METLLTYAEAAERLRIKPDTLQRKVTAGEINCRRFGRSVRFTEADLEDFIERSAVPARTARRPYKPRKR